MGKFDNLLERQIRDEEDRRQRENAIDAERQFIDQQEEQAARKAEGQALASQFQQDRPELAGQVTANNEGQNLAAKFAGDRPGLAEQIRTAEPAPAQPQEVQEAPAPAQEAPQNVELNLEQGPEKFFNQPGGSLGELGTRFETKNTLLPGPDQAPAAPVQPELANLPPAQQEVAKGLTALAEQTDSPKQKAEGRGIAGLLSDVLNGFAVGFGDEDTSESAMERLLGDKFDTRAEKKTKAKIRIEKEKAKLAINEILQRGQVSRQNQAALNKFTASENKLDRQADRAENDRKQKFEREKFEHTKATNARKLEIQELKSKASASGFTKEFDKDFQKELVKQQKQIPILEGNSTSIATADKLYKDWAADQVLGGGRLAAGLDFIKADPRLQEVESRARSIIASLLKPTFGGQLSDSERAFLEGTIFKKGMQPEVVAANFKRLLEVNNRQIAITKAKREWLSAGKSPIEFDPSSIGASAETSKAKKSKIEQLDAEIAELEK